MDWTWIALGAGVSFLLMAALVVKWQLQTLPSLGGALAVTLAAALPFAWIYPLLTTRGQLAAAFGGQVILALGLGLLLLTFRFWRDPERSPPQEEGVVLSAADGEVVYVRHVDGADAPLVTKGNRTFSLDELTGARLLVGGAWMVGVGMSFLDVHVNRSPIHGRVRFKKDVPGEFFSLRKEEAPFLNARMTTVIENTSLSVVVVQVASRLVRRVQSYVEVGDSVAPGQRMGMIRFGSLVVMIFPAREDLRVEVELGERVTAGLSVLARYGPDQSPEG